MIRPAFRRLHPLFLVVWAILWSAAAAAEPGLPQGLAQGDSARVVEVVDGDTVVLEDGRPVRLVGIQAPKLPLDRPGFPTWPLAPEARQALERLILGRTVSLHYGGARTDRHGRQLAHLAREDGLWIQGEMLRLGLARVYTFPDNRTAAAEMLALERAARDARRGIWGHAFYAVHRPEDTPRLIDGFHLVEGTVRAAARVRSQVYLNFGEDWRTDFTISLDRRAQTLFRQAGVDPLTLAGRIIRARGWIKSRNGPMIEATHPEQIEVLR